MRWTATSPARLFMVTLVVLCMLAGCSSRPAVFTSGDVTFVVPGVAGATGEYNGLLRTLRNSRGGRVDVVKWGAPWPLFFVNFSTRSVHERAENELAERVTSARQADSARRIDLIGHSAGCGVILGALAKLDEPVRVDQVLLLAPSVSPGYDLRPALLHVGGMMHVMISERDTLFLSWRTGNFGTYDRIKTRAAGNCGFDLTKLPDDLRTKIAQHEYDPAWKSLGHDGGHFGALSEPFAREQLMPLLGTSRSSEASSR